MANKKKSLPVGFRETANGLLQYRFSVDGKRYSVYGANVKECRVKELEKREEIKQRIYQSGKGLKMDDYLDRWIENREQSVKSATIRTYKKLIRRICVTPIDEAGTRFGYLKLSEVESQNIRDLQKALRKKLKTKDENGKSITRRSMSTRTTNDCISLLKKALEAAKNERLITWNPCEPVERLKRSEDQARDSIHRALSASEVDTFMKKANELGSWYVRLYVFLLHTGLRIGEAAALAAGDVSGGVIRVQKTVTRTETRYEVANQTKTDAGRRTVPLRPEAKKAFDDQKAINKLLAGGKITDLTEPVFRMPKGGVIRPDRVNADIKRICEKTAAKWVYVENPGEAETGATFYKGTKITGTSTNERIFPCSGIKDAKAGDMYLNTDTMNTYRCTTGGSATGIDKFTCHAFRATFTSRCVADGVPVKELMEILGHTDVEMTLGLYAHSNEELKKEKLLAVNI